MYTYTDLGALSIIVPDVATWELVHVRAFRSRDAPTVAPCSGTSDIFHETEKQKKVDEVRLSERRTREKCGISKHLSNPRGSLST